MPKKAIQDLLLTEGVLAVKLAVECQTLVQSILRDQVSKDAYTRAEKQARAAARRVARQAEQPPAQRRMADGDGQHVLEFD